MMTRLYDGVVPCVSQKDFMSLRGSDLVKLAELIRLGAETALAFGENSANGHLSQVAEIAHRITTASDELKRVGEDIEKSRLTELP